MRSLFVLLALAVVAALAAASAAPAAPKPPAPTLSTLEPGAFRAIHQELPVNVVFVGYEQGAGPLGIDEGRFLSELPESYRTVMRAQNDWYGDKKFIGVDFSYDYNVVYADDAFEDAFFGRLGELAQPRPLTVFQDDYNEQENASQQVTDNHWIDAPSVEQWLADNAGASLGVDTSDYTIFFVNWWGREDFQFHVYTKTDEPDPDTGYNFGEIRDTRKIIAWGGTTPDDEESGLGSLHRIWFHDLSAGPEAWTDNWNVDDADLNGNGRTEYRMPPAWEYGTDGYRPFDDISGDLGKIARYVAINLLFTASPLYNPALSPPLLPEEIEIDVNFYEAEPGSDADDFVDEALLLAELSELQPLKTFTAEFNDLALSGRALQIYLCWVSGSSCFGNRMFGIAFADLFLYHQDQLMQYLEGDADYEIPVFAYNIPDELDLGVPLGYADDDWRTGTQSHVYAFDTPFIRSIGYGFTTTLIHEVGHHLGMSHPHDGYDYEDDVDYGPGDDFYFAWAGDESNTMMSYIDLNWDFSQFDRDNMSRYLTAAYVNQANAILESVVKSPRAGQVAGPLTAADGLAAQALMAYGGMDYGTAAARAKEAYWTVVDAARAINVKIEPQSWQADYKAKSPNPKFVDPVDYDSHHRFR